MHPDAPLRRITTWLAIFGYALVASGLPLPLGASRPDPASPTAKRLAGKNRTRPFPCMDRPCGCDTAEQCFTRCCCHTPTETLAWAKAHRVEADVLLALERRVAVAVRSEEGTCCAADASAAEPSCCASRRPAAGEPSREDRPAERTPTRSVVLRAMLACGGIVAEWFLAGVAVPPPKFEVFESLVCAGRVQAAAACEAGVPAAPDSPPPRAA